MHAKRFEMLLFKVLYIKKSLFIIIIIINLIKSYDLPNQGFPKVGFKQLIIIKMLH